MCNAPTPGPNRKSIANLQAAQVAEPAPAKLPTVFASLDSSSPEAFLKSLAVELNRNLAGAWLISPTEKTLKPFYRAGKDLIIAPQALSLDIIPDVVRILTAPYLSQIAKRPLEGGRAKVTLDEVESAKQGASAAKGADYFLDWLRDEKNNFTLRLNEVIPKGSEPPIDFSAAPPLPHFESSKVALEKIANWFAKGRVDRVVFLPQFGEFRLERSGKTKSMSLIDPSCGNLKISVGELKDNNKKTGKASGRKEIVANESGKLVPPKGKEARKAEHEVSEDTGRKEREDKAREVAIEFRTLLAIKSENSCRQNGEYPFTHEGRRFNLCWKELESRPAKPKDQEEAKPKENEASQEERLRRPIEITLKEKLTPKVPPKKAQDDSSLVEPADLSGDMQATHPKLFEFLEDLKNHVQFHLLRFSNQEVCDHLRNSFPGAVVLSKVNGKNFEARKKNADALVEYLNFNLQELAVASVDYEKPTKSTTTVDVVVRPKEKLPSEEK